MEDFSQCGILSNGRLWTDGLSDLGALMDYNIHRTSAVYTAETSLASRSRAHTDSVPYETVADDSEQQKIQTQDATVSLPVHVVPAHGFASLSLCLGAATSAFLANAAPQVKANLTDKALSVARQETVTPSVSLAFGPSHSQSLHKNGGSSSSKSKMVSSISALQTELVTPAPTKVGVPKKIGFTTAFPDILPFRSIGRGMGNPQAGAAGGKTSIVWFRSDLRVHDNEALMAANEESRCMLPVYCFDPRDYGKSTSGFDKTGPYRAKFLLECVANLRRNLRERGADLIVRVGRPEEVLLSLAKAVGANALYAHQEVTSEEVHSEEKVAASLKEEGVESKFFWGSTLFHLEDLPFKLENMPHSYGTFRQNVQNVKVRSTYKDAGELKGLPSQGNVKVGEIPSLQDLGLTPLAPNTRQENDGSSYSLIGGESEALKRLKAFASDALAGRQRGKESKSKQEVGDSLYGANFSCKISPWLAMGCLSPRRMYEDLKNAGSRGTSSTKVVAKTGDDSTNLNWLVFELLWRDFFRFITKKNNGHKLQAVAVASPAVAATA